MFGLARKAFRWVVVMTGALLACVIVAASGRSPPIAAIMQDTVSARSAASPESPLWIEMRNVTMHLDERATIRVRRLRGEMVSTSAGEPAVLDDRESFSIRVSSGTVALTGADLSTLMNDFIFAYRGTPLRNLRARPDAGYVHLTGTMRKGVDLRFEITSTMSLTPEGLIRLHPTRTRIFGIDGQKLMDALGLHLDDLLDLKGSRGASVKGDDIYLDPTKILPPPAMTGTIGVAGIQGNEVVIEFAVAPEDSVFGGFVSPDSTTPNFVYFRGSRLRFGKLLMSDTDLQIVDADPTDPFDLNLKEYATQLFAGTSRTLPNLGLRVEMPDHDSLGDEMAASETSRRTPGPPSDRLVRHTARTDADVRSSRGCDIGAGPAVPAPRARCD